MKLTRYAALLSMAALLLSGCGGGDSDADADTGADTTEITEPMSRARSVKGG
jgi:ABC-type glycerol-3-phosphate transport system substrate-binding protein